MSKTHQDKRWQAARKRNLPRLRAMLPHPCPRCGRIMEGTMTLDLGHIIRNPELRYVDANLRLEHRSCNRRDGQRITTLTRKAKSTKKKEQLPSW